MSTDIETRLERKAREGKMFTYFYDDLTFDAAEKAEIIIQTFDEEVSIEGIDITSNAELLAWQAFGGAQFTGGTPMEPIPRNLILSRAPSAALWEQPTITDMGTPFSPTPIDLVGQQAAGNRAYIDATILTGPYYLDTTNIYMIQVTNADSLTRRISITVKMSQA